MKILIFDNHDKRNKVIEELLINYDVSFDNKIIDEDILILPITGIDDYGFIKKTNIKIDDLYEKHPFKYLICGVKNEYLIKFMENKGFIYSYYDEELLCMNSRFTAIGLLGLIITNINFSLDNRKILIIGYGHSGKEIAKILAPFTNKIDIYNRTYYQEIDDKYHYINSLNNLDYDIIINTVPLKLINEENIKNQIIFDIASKKGFSENIKVFHFLGIPNMMYKSSGKVIAEKIKNILEVIKFGNN